MSYKLPASLAELELPAAAGFFIVIGPGYWGRGFGLAQAYAAAKAAGLMAKDPFLVYYQSHADVAARILRDGTPDDGDLAPCVNSAGYTMHYGVEDSLKLIARRKVGKKLAEVV